MTKLIDDKNVFKGFFSTETEEQNITFLDKKNHEKLAQQKRVDALIGLHDAGREVPLTQERFLMLTKEYASEVIILMQKTLSDDSVGETRDRLNKIGGLIDSNKASLNFLSTKICYEYMTSTICTETIHKATTNRNSGI